MKITIQPTGGLCNRLRAIDSAIALQETTNSEEVITVIWEKNHELGASYDNLFKPSPKIKIIETLPLAGKRLLNRFHLKTVWNSLPPTKKNFPSSYWIRSLTGKEKKYEEVIYQDKMREYINENKDFNYLRGVESLYIVSCFRFWENSSSFRSFSPIQEIQSKIDALKKEFSPNTFGLHIRRTDHYGAIEKSPIQLFEAQIERELSQNPETKFYLATDDPSVETHLREKYPNKMIRNAHKAFGRDTDAALQGAVIDLFALSNTVKIYGSHASSFSETASQIGNIPLTVCELAS